MKERIAIVDDDEEIATIEKLTLEKEGYETALYGNGKDFLVALPHAGFALVVLDLMLPDIDGLTILKEIKRLTPESKVLIVSAKGMVSDKVEGLDLGADDYLEKPFSTLELASRVKARLRNGRNESVHSFGDFILDEKAHSFSKKDGKNISLTQSEWDLLVFFVNHEGEALSRETLYHLLWGEGSYESRALDVHIVSLRKKLGSPSLIETIYGIGYRFKA
jgi:DNA-binding response OmpR family regulator